MPIPTPRKDEKHDDFMQRCMGDAVMRREWPKQEQRAAVCERRYSKGKAQQRDGRKSRKKVL